MGGCVAVGVWRRLVGSAVYTGLAADSPVNPVSCYFAPTVVRSTVKLRTTIRLIRPNQGKGEIAQRLT